MTNPITLSPAAQAVVNAAIELDYGQPTPVLYRRLAAALRAVANYVPDHQMSAHMLHAIADELEGAND